MGVGSIGGGVSVGGGVFMGGGSVKVGGGWVEVGRGTEVFVDPGRGGGSVRIGVRLAPGSVGESEGVALEPVTGSTSSILIASANRDR